MPSYSIKNSAVTSRKTSLKKIDRKSKNKNDNVPYFHYKQFNNNNSGFSAENK